MPHETSFLTFTVECPICKTINEVEQVKAGAYTEGGRDTDFCPQSIEWGEPKYQAYHPLLYFTSTCSNCYYTREFTNAFREWRDDTAFCTYQLKGIKERHLDQLSAADSVIRSLGQGMEPVGYPNETAIIKLHLAVLDGKVAEPPNCLDQGRFYLRIAWVYRMLSSGEYPSVNLMPSLLKEIDARCYHCQDAIDRAQESVEAVTASVRAHFEAEQIPAQIRSQMFTYRDRYDSGLASLAESLKAGHERLVELRNLFEEYRDSFPGSQHGNGNGQFGPHHSFTDFMLSMKESWAGIVTSQHEALVAATNFYRKAFASGNDIPPGMPQIQASYLIAELSRRIGDHDEAKQFFSNTIRTGQEFIQQNQRDQSRTQLARKILELAIEQGRANLALARPA